MADVVINIRALDLTKGAFDSAMRSLRKLTNETRTQTASTAVGSAFRNLAKDVERYSKMSSEALRKEIRERRNAINTMTAMEARFRLHLLKGISDAEKAHTQSRLRRLSIHKSLLNREISEAGRALRQQETLEKQATKAKERELKARERAEKQLRMNALAAAKSYNAKVLAEDIQAAKKRQRAVDAALSVGSGAMKGIRRMGFNAIFAGSVVGSQASMLGSQLGGMLGGLGGTLSGGVTSLTGLGEKTIQVLTKVMSLATKAVASVASLYVNILTGLVGTVSAALPYIGIFISGVITGFGNALSGGMRMVGDLVSGAVELVGGAIQGVFNTVTSLASGILKAIAGAVSTVFEFIGGILEKIGGVVGEAFGRILEMGISTFEEMIGKIAEFRDLMADVFTQVPEIGEKGFQSLIHSVEKLADKLPIKKQDLAKGLFEIVSTQLTNTPEEAMKVLTATSRAAIAGGHEADVVETTKAATAVMSAFNLKADDAEKTLSKLLKAAVLGRFSFKDLAEGIQNVSGIAANFETTLDDLLTSYVLASQSMAKATVPVAVKNLILSLAAPTREAQKAMDAAHISLKTYTAAESADLEAKKQVIDALESEIEKYSKIHKKTDAQKDALLDMRKALKQAKTEFADSSRAAGHFVGAMEGVKRIMKAGLSPAQLREVIPERRALSAAAAIMSAMDREGTTAKAIAEDNGQQMETALKIRGEVLTNRLKLLSNIWENTWNGMFNFVAPILTKIVGHISDRLMGLRQVFADAFTGEELADFTKLIEDSLAYVVDRAFDAVEWIVKNWRKIYESAKEVWEGVKTVATAAWNAIKFGYQEIAKLFGGEDDFGKKFKQAFEDAVSGATALYDAIKKIADGNMEPILGLIDKIKIGWAELTDFMRSSLADALAWIQGPLNEIGAQVEDAAKQMQHPATRVLAGAGPRELAKNRAGGISSIESFLSPEGLIAQMIGQTVNPSGNFAKGLSPAQILMGGRISPKDDKDKQIAELLVTIKDKMIAEGKAGGRGVFNTYNGNDIAKMIADAVKEKFGRGGITDYNWGETHSVLAGGDLKETADWLAQALQAVRQASGQLEAYGYKPGADQDNAFKNTFDFSKVVDGLKEAQAPAVKAQVEADQKRREAEALAVRQRDELIKLMGGSPIGPKGPQGPTGVAGPVAAPPMPAAPTSDTEIPNKTEKQVLDDLDNLDDIKQNTKDTADAIDNGVDTGPSVGDDEALIHGKIPKAPVSHIASEAAKKALDAAQSLEGDTKPAKEKKPKKPHKPTKAEIQEMKPGWWPESVPYGNQNYSKHDMIKLRKSFNRDQNNKAFNPFGDQGMFGFHKGPGFPTLDAPIRDKDGRIIGFRGFQGPSAHGYAKRTGPAWRTPEGKTSDDLKREAADRLEREKKRQRDKDAARALAKMSPEERNQKLINEIPGLGGLIGRLPDSKPGHDISKDAGVDPFGAGGGEGQTAPIKETATKATAASAELTKQNAALAALATALNTLFDLQTQAATGTTQFSEDQVKALADVGISVKAMLEAVKESHGKLIDIIADFKASVSDQIKEIQNQTRKAEVNTGA